MGASPSDPCLGYPTLTTRNTQHPASPPQTPSALRHQAEVSFACFDEEGRGAIQAADLRRVARDLDFPLSSVELEGVMREVVGDRGGAIPLDAWTRVMSARGWA
jgi:Ca2+-binding EF-hand superfamily protein